MMDVCSQMSGWVVEICVQPGDKVQKGQVLLILESMKMRIPVESPRDGNVSTIHVKPEAVVQAGDVLISLK